MSVAATPNLYRSNLNLSGSNALQQINEQSQQQTLHLPKIVHPKTRIDDPNSLNVTARAMSRASSLGNLVDRYRGEPQEFEDSSFVRSKHSKHSKRSNKLNNSYNQDLNSSFNIPENVKAVYTPDINKVSLPIFGGRPQSSASVASSFVGGRNSAIAAQKIDIEEYFQILREKIKGNHHEIKSKFRNADPEGKGGISKEALGHIIASILGPSKQLSHQHFIRLIEKLGLKNRSIIRFEDFITCMQENRSEMTEWVDPVRNGPFNTPTTRKATQVFVILKEKSNLRTSDMVNLIPQLNGGQSNKIFKPELLNTINGMAIKMESEEFEKLWKKFDPENNGFVPSKTFLKRLGVLKTDSVQPGPLDETIDSLNDSLNASNMFDESIPQIPKANMSAQKIDNTYKVKSASSRGSRNPVDKWLKKKFRNGFSKMKASFEELDLQKTGQVRRDQFLNVLRQHGLQLEEHLLDSFLQRCNVKLGKHSILVTYTDFLEKFQNRSDRGLAYKVITNGDDYDDGAPSLIGQVERKLIKMFQNDFLSLLQIFRKIDRYKSNTISKQEFRAAIESHFGIELSDDEYEEFLRIAPKDGANKIKYLEFMTRFDSDASSTLFDGESVVNDDYQPKKVKKYEPIIEEEEEYPRRLPNGRSVDQLTNIIKNYIKNHYKDVENAWSEVDTLNTNEMSKDMMWSLFKKLKISPQISRDEIEILWDQFILKDNKKLEYWQFVRHFGYSKKSAAYESAKRAPPKRGDNDMMLTSNKLGRDSILIRGSVQSKLILQFDVLKRSFLDFDPYYTNYLLRDEFEEILRELCPELNKQEMEYICSKHEHPTDGRINYVDFLSPYAPKRSREKPYDSLKSDDQLSSRLDMNDTLTIKLRMKLTDCYKDLRRMFKQHDFKQTGFVNVSVFKEVLRANRVNLSEDDTYSLMRRLDKDVTGLINYNKFINEIIKP